MTELHSPIISGLDADTSIVFVESEDDVYSFFPFFPGLLIYASKALKK
jgi:hypothetical protein